MSSRVSSSHRGCSPHVSSSSTKQSYWAVTTEIFDSGPSVFLLVAKLSVRRRLFIRLSPLVPGIYMPRNPVQKNLLSLRFALDHVPTTATSQRCSPASHTSKSVLLPTPCHGYVKCASTIRIRHDEPQTMNETVFSATISFWNPRVLQFAVVLPKSPMPYLNSL
ncbi:hypothetical protein LZ30DRAFT_432493 [Colletotrichum cereale]|nr:hypothetical protein LZ30DRAFT_432493 [Colletotrichum cereale]